MKPILPACAALCLTAACEEPIPPSITTADVDRAYVEAARISRLPVTDVINVPTGTVTYDGQIGVDVSGDAAGSILADMTMIVGFDTDAITGNVTNINLIDPNGVPDQRMGGSLDIDGIETNGQIAAVATGQVSAVDIYGESVTADMDIDLTGAVVDDQSNGDAIFGSATGSAEGDFYLYMDGVFFGTAR